MISTKERIKLVIADDHPLFRRGLKNAFSETSDIEVIAEAENGDELLNKIKGLDLSIVLMDVAMPGIHGLDLLKKIREEYPKTPVLVLTVYPEEHYAVRFFKAGASGFIHKESSTDLIYAAVRKVARGGKFASPEITEKLAFDFGKTDRPLHENLSDREHQVFMMLAEGESPTEIGKKLSLSVKTISTHRSRILEKMQMKKNAELIHYAISNRLLQ
ncbi:MAG: DNA-binding response regulator [Nitrospina sp.]|nr:DNA-binding response regulator [Nitrospina sp.]|tara:strand:- start:2314 stop:2961 length:648 start_codon:yes stop_codon:yes gene_type:complete